MPISPLILPCSKTCCLPRNPFRIALGVIEEPRVLADPHRFLAALIPVIENNASDLRALADSSIMIDDTFCDIILWPWNIHIKVKLIASKNKLNIKYFRPCVRSTNRFLSEAKSVLAAYRQRHPNDCSCEVLDDPRQ